MANVKKFTSLRNINLDEFALEPGQEVDLRSEREISGLPPATERPHFERSEAAPGIPQGVAQEGRRISPLVSGIAPVRAAAPIPRRYPPARATARAPVSPVVESVPSLKTIVAVAAAQGPAMLAAFGRTPAESAILAREQAKINADTREAFKAAPRPKLTHAQQRGKLVVQLGRFGDIINLLPLLEEESRQLRHPVRLMVAKAYASVLEGVSYVTPVIFDGDFGDLDRALAQAREIDPDARCAQVYQTGRVFPRREDSFARDSWARLGKSFLWEQLPLVFDRRSREREAALVAQVDTRLPLVLINLQATSYPFPHVEEVRIALTEAAVKHSFALLDLASFRAERIYDLLGLFDRAACLVTADTATLHLAAASSVPVVAFRVGLPWYASPRRANHILNRRYTDIDVGEIVETVVDAATKKSGAAIVHLWPAREASADETARIARVAPSWYDAGVPGLSVHESKLPRNSKTKLGDAVAAPYILDLFTEGLPQLKTDEDILLYTNSDVGFTESTIRNVRRLCLLKGACYGYRFDLPAAMLEEIGAPDYLTTVSGQCHGGLDLFAFTRSWLTKYGGLLPDMLIGRTNWDSVFRDIIKRTGGGEVYGAIWHEHHESWWKANSNSPGNLFNTKLMNEYRAHNDITRPYDR